MQTKIGLAFVTLAFLGIVSCTAYLQVGVWKECRAEHSFWYCMNLVSGK